MHRSMALATLGSLALSGCAAVFPPTVPEPYPLLPLEPAPEGSISRIVSSSAALTGPRALSIDLPTALELAKLRSPDLRLARLQEQQAAAVSLSNELSIIPSVNPVFRAFDHEGIAQRQNGTIVDVSRQNYLAQALIIAFVNPGPAIFATLASKRREEAARASGEAARLDAERDAAIGYFELMRARALLDVVREGVEEATALESFERSRETLGAGTRFLVLRATAELAERRGDLAAGQERAAVASARLLRTLLLPADVELVPRDRSAVLVEVFRGGEEDAELVERAVGTRPEVQALRAEIGAREREVDEKTYGPLVPFVAGFVQTGGFGGSPGSIGPSQDAFVLVGWEIGPGGILDVARIRRARVALRRARTELEELHARVAREAVSTHADLVAARGRLDAAHAEVESARANLKLARGRLAKGVGIQLELLDAQREMIKSRVREVEAIVDVNEAQVRVLRAIGAELP